MSQTLHCGCQRCRIQGQKGGCYRSVKMFQGSKSSDIKICFCCKCLGGVEGPMGPAGLTPYIGENGNWWFENSDTGVRAIGVDGQTHFIGENGNWWLEENDTGVTAQGQSGMTPVVGYNNNWWIGDEDTGVLAQAQHGESPVVGENGNWHVADVDSGIPATGPAGADGADATIPYHQIENGDWVLYYLTQEEFDAVREGRLILDENI